MDDLNINKFLRAFLNWQSAQSMIENAGENAEAEKLAKKMEREAARHLDVAFRECVESVIRPDSALPGASDLPFIMGPGANRAYPPIGDAPIPLCECGHARNSSRIFPLISRKRRRESAARKMGGFFLACSCYTVKHRGEQWQRRRGRNGQLKIGLRRVKRSR
jgi:hypothetical protein